jgi:histidyl-tRNA synthetase
MEISSLPGFREFYPEDLALRRHIFRTWREVAERYGFVEYDGPPLEPLELYTRKSGEEIVAQLYAFRDRGDREVALRPEMTPTFARMVSSRAAALPKPIKWFSIPQLFRYERPQRGRLREHFQLNLDIVGEEGVIADAELVAAALDMLRAFGLGREDVVARVSDRRLVRAILIQCGVPEDGLLAAFAALDKADREAEETTVGKLVAAGADSRGARRILALGELSLDEVVEAYGEASDVVDAAGRLERFFGHLDSFGLGGFAAFDAGLVRGLAYYTGLVFELWDRKGELRAICGGGRYDDLLAALGGVDLPALGFGMGDVVLGEILRERGLVPKPSPAVEDYVVYVSEQERDLALRVVRALRSRGRKVGFDYGGRSVGRQFKAADRAGATRVFVLGPDEVARDAVVVRSMEAGSEEEVRLSRLLDERE